MTLDQVLRTSDESRFRLGNEWGKHYGHPVPPSRDLSVLVLPELEAPVERPAVPGVRADLIAAGLALALVAAASAVVWVLHLFSPARIYAWAAPLFGNFVPEIGPGTPIVLVVAVLVVARGPEVAARLRWSLVCVTGYAAAVLWTFGLAMIKGWQVGIAGQLSSGDQYLRDVPRATDISTLLHTYTSHILLGPADHWVTQVSGHPPGTLLVFVWLDRLGLGGGGWAGMTCLVVGSLAAIAVPSTVRALGDEQAARAIVPFTVLFPGAIWIGESADGLFTGVTSVAVLLLALGAGWLREDDRPLAGGVACLAGGLLLGYGVFLSYGLVLLAPIALAVCLLRRSWWAIGFGLVGALLVVATFAMFGFWWWDGYQLVIQRYYQDLGTTRPYSYWVWADLACLVVSAGPLIGPGLRRSFLDPIRQRRFRPVACLVLAAALAIAVADKSGLSKAEVERIWLPFGVWLTSAAALLPVASRRWWLAGQALTALVVAHLVLTKW